ncbi:MAG: hypothetical protein ACR2QL_01650 [Woeseiaceae bacterium]
MSEDQLGKLEYGSGTSAPPSPEAVLDQLDKVLSSRSLRDAPTLQNLLRFIVDETLVGRRKELNVSTIATAVFNKGVDFRNSEDSIVRVAAHRLRTALALYYAANGRTDDVIIKLEPGRYAPVMALRSEVREMPTTDDVGRLFDTYHRVATPNAHRAAYQAAASAVEARPDDPKLLAALAELSIDAYVHAFDDTEDHLEEARQITKRASELTPANPHICFVNGLIALQDGDLDTAEQQGRAMLASCQDDQALAAQATWLITLAARRDNEGHLGLVEIPKWGDHPGWLHHPNFLSYYHRGDYENALSSAIAFGMPEFFWGPLERAAALAQLGLIHAARTELDHVNRLNPKFAEEPRRFLRSFIPNENVLEHVLDGLKKAGLKTT